MYDPEMRKDCPMRGNLGNCTPVGGFCVDAVSDEICEAVHNAYQHGYGHAIIRLKEQEKQEEQKAKPGKWIQAEEDTNVWECSECGDMQIIIDGTPFENNWFFCPHCGANLVELIWKAGEDGKGEGCKNEKNNVSTTASICRPTDRAEGRHSDSNAR